MTRTEQAVEKSSPTSPGTPAPQVTPEPIIRTIAGVMAAQHLMVANEVGIFEALGDDTLTLHELTERTELPVRSVRIVADALVACGLLLKEGGRYVNTPETRTFLSGRTPADLRPYLRMAHRVGYPRWGEFESVVRGGGGAQRELFHVSSEEQEIMSAGIEAMTAPSAARLAELYDFSRVRRLLDVGGGAGLHLRAILERYPDLEGTLFELPPVAERARRRLASLVDAGRAAVVEGDVFDDPLPTGHDVLLVSHLLHIFTGDRNEVLLRRLRDSVEAGVRLVVVDFWTNADHTEPVAAALSAGEFYRLSGGDVYSVDEAREWLGRTGWAFLGHQPLGGPESFIEAEATP